MVEGGKRARQEVLSCPACGESLKANTDEELKVMPDDEKRAVASAQSKEETSLIAVGDVCLAGRINEKLGMTDPFELVEDEIRNCTISLGNLECVVTDKGKPIKTSEPILKVSPFAINCLGVFTVLSFANNHTLDCGIEGMRDTSDALTRHGILTLGSGENYQQAIRPLILERNSLRIAFISFVYSFLQDGIPLLSTLQRMRLYNRPGPARYFEGDVLGWIRKLKEKTDCIVASIHWDKSDISYPAPPQRFLAEKLIDCGVDVILGHHSHYIQGIQKYHNGLIFYSLGNFVFDPFLSSAKYGLMVKLNLSAKGISGHKLIPININENCQPMELTETTAFQKWMHNISAPLAYSHSEYYKFWSEYVSESYLEKSCAAVRANVKPLFHGRARPYAEKFCTNFIRSMIRLKCARITP